MHKEGFLKRSRGFLLLDDGTVYSGREFGHPLSKADEVGEYSEENDRAAGEVVFNTGMCGYHEILTDPSYTGQIVTMTYPLAGNYGTDDSWSETHGSSIKPERKVKASGMIVRNLYEGPVSDGRNTLDKYLKDSGISGLTEIDTRSLTVRIREKGVPRGVMIAPSDPLSAELSSDDIRLGLAYLKGYPEMTGRNLVSGQDVQSPEKHNSGGSPDIALIDCGIKENIQRQLIGRGCAVSVYPHATGAETVMKGDHHGVLISNGPGDPAVLEEIIETASILIGRLPVFGICLGHQIISLALGGKTKKMSFGHHGVNNPVRDERTGKVFVTSQNHGFMVTGDSLPEDVEIWFRNANDKTIEGIISESRMIASAQFHPESAPGPEDTFWIFDEFIKMANTARNKGGKV